MSRQAGGMTQHEVAKILGISQARVMQIEHAAYQKLRKLPEAREWLELAGRSQEGHRLHTPKCDGGRR